MKLSSIHDQNFTEDLLSFNGSSKVIVKDFTTILGKNRPSRGCMTDNRDVVNLAAVYPEGVPEKDVLACVIGEKELNYVKAIIYDEVLCLAKSEAQES